MSEQIDMSNTKCPMCNARGFRLIQAGEMNIKYVTGLISDPENSEDKKVKVKSYVCNECGYIASLNQRDLKN